MRDASLAIDILAATAIFLPYYWLVFRQDSRAQPEAVRTVEGPPPPPRRGVTVLIPGDGAAFQRGLESALGYRVTALAWADPGAALPALAEPQFDDLARRIGDAVGHSVLVVPDGTEVRVLSYD